MATIDAVTYILGSKRIRITSYHPIANGLIERFHRQLKVSLKCSSNSIKWTGSLPLVPLGIRTALKDGLSLQCTTAELVYGTTLCLPHEFFTTTSNFCDDPASYVTRLKASISQVKPPLVCTQLQNNTYLSNYLSNCTHVFVRNDKMKKPLQPPYNGPFNYCKVIKCDNKYFTLQFQDSIDTVPLDKLKSVHTDNSATSTSSTESRSSSEPVTSTPTMKSSRVTPSGCHVCWPKYLS